MFGLVVVIYLYKIEEEVIEIVNNFSYGFGNIVFGINIVYVCEVVFKIEVGMSWINVGWVFLFEFLFGGVKYFGYGCELSEIGFNEFVN